MNIRDRQIHGLWLAQIVYLAMRSILKTVWYEKNQNFT